jgi:hypothetical protein
MVPSPALHWFLFDVADEPETVDEVLSMEIVEVRPYRTQAGSDHTELGLARVFHGQLLATHVLLPHDDEARRVEWKVYRLRGGWWGVWRECLSHRVGDWNCGRFVVYESLSFIPSYPPQWCVPSIDEDAVGIPRELREKLIAASVKYSAPGPGGQPPMASSWW